MVRFTPLLALLIVLPATAQDIPAQAAVGQCYSACATTLYAANERVQVATERNRQLFWWNIINQNEFQTSYCVAYQNLVIEADICYAGCRDVEAGYGAVDSLAEGIFVPELFAQASWIQQSGLYPSNQPYPAQGTAQFTSACNTFLGIATDALSRSVVKSTQQVDSEAITEKE